MALTHLAVRFPVAVVNLPDHFRSGAGHQLAHFEELQNWIIVQNILGASSVLELGKHGRRWHLPPIPLRTYTLALHSVESRTLEGLRSGRVVGRLMAGRICCSQSTVACNKGATQILLFARFFLTRSFNWKFSNFETHIIHAQTPAKMNHNFSVYLLGFSYY